MLEKQIIVPVIFLTIDYSATTRVLIPKIHTCVEQTLLSVHLPMERW